jgi:clan AA aspartic protease
MISGYVNSELEAIIEVVVRGPLGARAQVEAQIDTGFSDYLTLPGDVNAAMGLEFDYATTMFVADNSPVEMRKYQAEVIWDGHPRSIFVHESESLPLVGMLLIQDFHLSIEAADGGAVSLTRLLA